MKKRIFGLETEFGLALTSRGRGALPVSRVVPYLFAKFNTPADFWNVFLENGARFYLAPAAIPNMQNGQQYSALELQKTYLELAHRYYSSRPQLSPGL